MSHFWRTTLFIFFLIAFLVSAPLLVLYTAGYRLDLSNGRIVHTAVLNISSIPRNASIVIDGVIEQNRTPAVLDRILPGQHEVRLEKETYVPWKKNISFQSREAVITQDVILFLDSLPETLQTLHAIQTLLSPDGKHVAYITQQSSWIEVWTTDGTAESTKLLMRLPYDERANYALSWSQAGTYLCLARELDSLTQLTISKIDNGASVRIDEKFSFVDDYWWDAGQDNAMFVNVAETSHWISLADSTNRALQYAPSRARTFDARDVFWEESNNRVVLSFFDGTTASIITYLPLGNYEFQKAPAGLIALYDSDRSRFILIDTNNREQPILFSEDATRVLWNQTNDALLFTGGYDLKVYRPANHETQTITRLSERIDEIGWYVLGNVALYQAGGRTLSINLNETAPETQTLLANDARGIFWQNESGKTLFLFTQTDDGQEIRKRALQE